MRTYSLVTVRDTWGGLTKCIIPAVYVNSPPPLLVISGLMFGSSGYGPLNVKRYGLTLARFTYGQSTRSHSGYCCITVETTMKRCLHIHWQLLMINSFSVLFTSSFMFPHFPTIVRSYVLPPHSLS